MPSDARPLLRLGMPLGVVLAITVGDLVSGSNIVFGLLCAVPLLASQVERPRYVVAWGC